MLQEWAEGVAAIERCVGTAAIVCLCRVQGCLLFLKVVMVVAAGLARHGPFDFAQGRLTNASVPT
jgi:hypothetical protein